MVKDGAVDWDYCAFHEAAQCLPDDTCRPLAEYKWDQPPVSAEPDDVFYGWDEQSTWWDFGFTVADDWVCVTADPVTTIRWWGSFLGWDYPWLPPREDWPWHFHILIWTDVPGDPADPASFSHPGVVIHEIQTAHEAYTASFAGWTFDPRAGEYESTFLFEQLLEPEQWFYQEPAAEPTVYWVSIAACYGGMPPPTDRPWGWTTRPRSAHTPAPDDAVVITEPPMPAFGSVYISGWPIRYPAGTSWDVSFELVSAPVGHVSKWGQPPDTSLPGLPAHDWLEGPFLFKITLADQWQCEGGDVADLHWFGNYEVDASGAELRGSGINYFRLSIHENSPGMPWCLPWEPPVWLTDVPFDQVAETDTGLVNSEGSPIYRYEFLLTDPFPQLIGEIYWLDISAVSNDPADPAQWRWQEAGRNVTPILCPAAARTDPGPGTWQSIGWPDGTYTDLAFIVTSQIDEEPYTKWHQPPHPYVPDDAFHGWDEYSVWGGYQIAADDWYCATEDPVTDIHWWGSFIDWLEPSPPQLPDRFHIAIWTDVPADPGAPGDFSHPGEVIHEIVCENYSWEFVGWDFDPREIDEEWTRPPEATFKFEQDLAEADWFYQGPGENIYWVSIAAEYDAPVDPSYPFGWKTRPRAEETPAPDDAVIISAPTRPGVGDDYVAGMPIEYPAGTSWDLAFQLTTRELPQACCLPEDDECVDVPPSECLGDEGQPMGPGTTCATTLCWCDWEADEESKYVQLPDATPNGVDVMVDSSELPRIMADDFPCARPGPITEVHLWGSWLRDIKGTITEIGLSFWSDVPHGPDGYSTPGEVLWSRHFGPGEFSEKLYAQVDPSEWWWNPRPDVRPIEFGDSQVWQVSICMDPDEAFYQEGGAGELTIYWLAVTVTTDGGRFGWKTRQWPDHFRDDAVWTEGELPPWWLELRYPSGHPYHGLEDDSIDLAFALVTGEPELYSKWLQPPHGGGDGFDAASDLWWPEPPPKWEQRPDLDLPGLPAHDEGSPDAAYSQIILADEWRCRGGDVNRLDWWGNYELDALGQEIRGAGIDHFRLSIHLCGGGDPWCLPMEPPAWVLDVPFDAIPEVDTGLVNSEGSTIYSYQFALPEPFVQEEGMFYWFDLTAVSVDPMDPARWRWQEANRSPVFLGHAPAAQSEIPGPAAWRSITWPTIPISFSDMAFRVSSNVFVQEPDPNKVVVDDFISDGRPIDVVNWWGSYLDDQYAPDSPSTSPYAMDGWLISFHHAMPWAECPPQFGPVDAPTALGVYYAPLDAVSIAGLFMADCFGHGVYEYIVDLSRCCLLCSEVDPRTGDRPAQVGVFRERHGLRYWLGIQAVAGVTWEPPACGFEDRILTGHLPSPETPDGHFWGWHTSPEEAMPFDPLDDACTGTITSFVPDPPECWVYDEWEAQPWLCPEPAPPPPPVHMAFALLTSVERTYVDAYSVGRHDASGGYPGGSIPFPIAPIGGVMEPREQVVGEMAFSLVFAAVVDPDDYTVEVWPDLGLTATLAPGPAENELILTFDGVFPTGWYEIKLLEDPLHFAVFAVCYSQGDVNCSGDTTGLDLAAIQSPGSWNKDLSVAGVNPRADVNRDGQVTALDLAKAQSPAYWNKPVPPLPCICP